MTKETDVSAPVPSQKSDPTLGGILDRIGTLSISLYASQQSEAALTAELAEARAEIAALTAVNEELSAKVSNSGEPGVPG